MKRVDFTDLPKVEQDEIVRRMRALANGTYGPIPPDLPCILTNEAWKPRILWDDTYSLEWGEELTGALSGHKRFVMMLAREYECSDWYWTATEFVPDGLHKTLMESPSYASREEAQRAAEEWRVNFVAKKESENAAAK
jgi:hypothetical protein